MMSVRGNLNIDIHWPTTMGKLNIAHHKSYHPYRRDNIERVRRDEEEAKVKEAQEEGRMQLAVCHFVSHPHYLPDTNIQDAEARIDLLRSRASGSSKPNKRQIEKAEEKLISQRTSEAVLNAGHINFFEDLEHVSTLPLSESADTDVNSNLSWRSRPKVTRNRLKKRTKGSPSRPLRRI
jgi:hypothetical protein